MAWHIVQKLVEGTGTHSSLIGKFWITSFFVIRFLLVMAIAKSTWSSTQGDFVCNTLSPGCKQVCFNEFNPVAPTRYWFFQLLGVSLTSIIFNVYTTHKLALVTKAIQKKKKWMKEKKQKSEEAKEAIRKARESQIKSADDNAKVVEKTAKPKAKEEKEEKKDEDCVATKLTEDSPSKLYLAYFAMVLFRLGLELSFMIGQYYLYSYKFVVPELFQCRHWPCPNVVDCFVSRPKEKTIMICAFYATGCIMVVLNVMELVSLGGKIGEAWSTRHQDITKEVFGDSAGPQFDVPNGVRAWGPGAEGVYAVQPSGYPDAVGIPMLYSGYTNNRRKGRKSGLAKMRYQDEYVYT